MKAEGFTTVMGGSLACSIKGEDWNFSIRRVDGTNHGPFYEFHNKEVSANDVAVFLPNWASLDWIEIKDSMLGKSESYAKDVEFKVNVQSSERSTKNHKEVVEAFMAFMQTATPLTRPGTGFIITNPLTGNPLKRTPDGISLEGKIFATKEELEQFVNEHWTNAVFVKEGKA